VVSALAGVFVGGKSSRFGGVPKGLLTTASGTSLIARWSALFSELGVPMVLVGAREEYRPLGIRIVPDQGADLGPLGGMLALLEYAPSSTIVAVACDMPYVSARLVERLLATEPEAPALAARRDGRWEPFCARYHAPRVLPLARDHAARSVLSLQALLDAAGAAELTLSADDARELSDWDTPEDRAHLTMERTTSRK